MTIEQERENRIRVALVLMASGFGTRFGGNKLLAEYKGKPLFEYGLEAALESGADRIVLVTRYREICSRIRQRELPVELVWNAHPDRGISESLKLGLSRCREYEGCGFLVCDQPELRGATLRQLLHRFHERPDCIWALSNGIHFGNPAVFPRRFFPELGKLQGDHGGKQIIHQNPDYVRKYMINKKIELKDIDQKADLL